MARPRLVLAAFWVFAGVMHFVRPRDYENTVPEYVPISPERAVRWSGYAEVTGGVLVASHATRRLGRWWLLGLLAAVYPANIHMALDPAAVAARGTRVDRLPRWLLWARLPVQGLFAIWAWRATE